MRMLVFTRTHTTPKTRKKAGLPKTSMRRTLLTMAKRKKKLQNRKPSPRKASLVARTKKKLKQLIRLLSILPPLMRKMILMRICRSVIRKVVSGSTRKQMNTTCEIGSVCPPTNTTVCSSISASGLAGFTTCTRIKWAAFSAMTWVSVKQSKLPLYARVSLTLDKYGRSWSWCPQLWKHTGRLSY